MTVVNVAEKVYTVEWNGQPRPLAVPRDNLAYELTMTDLPPLADPAAAIVEALEAPIGVPPLSEQVRPGMKVALLTGDRITDVMLGVRDGVGPRVLDHLNRLGIRDEDVTLVHAGGSHYNPDWQDRFGEALLGRVRAIRHDAWDESTLRYLGVTRRATPVWVNRAVTEADFVLGIGEISPNVHGGWTGGGKIIVPGVAGMDTIEQNHHYLMAPLNPLGLADGNPLRLDMEEGAGLAGLPMKVDVLVDSQARVVQVFAGDFLQEHRAALPAAREIWMTKMEPVDIVVVSPGERSDRYLAGAMFIRLEAADLALKEDGIIILALSAAGGWAAPEAVARQQAEPPDTMRLSLEEMAHAMVRKHGNMRNVSICYTAKRVLTRHRTILVCDGIGAEEARGYGFADATPDFAAALGRALAERGPGATVATLMNRGIAWRMMPWREG
jgi:nickel-dependent lactate racemase